MKIKSNKKTRVSLSENELQVLRIIWDHDACTIEDVHEHLKDNFTLFAILRLMHGLHDRNVLQKLEVGSLRLYKVSDQLSTVRKYLEKKDASEVSR